jgi:hypothetical protein
MTYQYTVGKGGTPDTVRCYLIEPLGSTADKAHYTIRAPVNFKTEKGEFPVDNSTRVLVLFIDGRTDRGVIVGCLPNERDAEAGPDLGHHSFESFNGIETEINKDGEYTVTSTLQTIDAQTNEVAEPDAAKAGTFFKIDKDGSVHLDTTQGDLLSIDRAAGNTRIDASNNVYIGATGASENLVLGQQLKAAFDALNTFLQSLLTTPAIPGQPLSSPKLIADLNTWKATWLTTEAFLSDNKFTEKS